MNKNGSFIRFFVRMWHTDRNRTMKIALKFLKRDLKKRKEIYDKIPEFQRKEWLDGNKDPVMVFLREVIKLSDDFNGGKYLHG